MFQDARKQIMEKSQFTANFSEQVIFDCPILLAL
jgi:hypothetical protein